MGVQFSGYSKSAKAFYPAETESAAEFHCHNQGAGKIGRALGLDDMWNGGTMSVSAFESRIFRNADGHSDPYVAEWLLVLAQLCRDVKRNLPRDAVITWG